MDQPQLVAPLEPTAANRPDRIRFTDHQGQRILIFDFEGMKDPEASLREIDRARLFVAAQPLKSLRVLTRVRDARYNGPVLNGMKELAAHDEPYVIASAVVGLSGLLRIAYTAVTAFSKRNIRVFDTDQEALDWLASQPAGAAR